MRKRYQEGGGQDELNLVGRSRADRLLDGILNKQRRQLSQQIAKSSPKRVKQNQPRLPSDCPNTYKTEAEVPKTQPSKSVTEALNEIIQRHLKNRSKFAKSVKLVNSMLKADYLDQTNSPLFLEVFYNIALSDSSYTCEEGRKEVFKLFNEGIKLYLSFSFPEIPPASHLKQRKSLLDVLTIRFHHICLYTDDTYQFNNAINHLKTQLSEIVAHYKEHNMLSVDSPILEREEDSQIAGCHQQEEKLKDQIENSSGKSPSRESDSSSPINSNYPNLDAHSDSNTSQQLWEVPGEDALWALKYELFYDTLPTIYNFHHHAWAQVSVENFFQQVYLNRVIFNKHQQERISSWQSSIKNNKKVSHDIRAHSIGEAINPVKDAREERISTVHGSVIWSAKQFGL